MEAQQETKQQECSQKEIIEKETIQQEIAQLSEEFRGCREVMTAIGDEVRQHIVLVMMQSNSCGGLRVGDIAARTNLSRPAVSHHLQILKRAGVLQMRREGTKNYYYFDPDMESFDKLIHMLESAKHLMRELPDRNSENE